MKETIIVHQTSRATIIAQGFLRPLVLCALPVYRSKMSWLYVTYV